jgi:very-short-patch-repair endonuclease
VSVAQLVVEAGGFATRAVLVAATSRAEVDRALQAGEVVADARGRYVTPATDDAVRRAHALDGVLCLTSAALHHGWEVKVAPEEPHVAVPRKRKVVAERRRGVRVHWLDLDPDDVMDGIVTDEETTLRHCLTRLPRDEALAVADSALRHGVPPATLRRVARSVGRGPGAKQARWVAQHADGDAANPFESCARDICLDVPGLHVRPQVTLRGTTATARPDLVDTDLGLVVECDSFEWHGDRGALRRDARRYNLLVVDGWLVLRFAWEDVMLDRDYVLSVLVSVVRLVHGQAKSRPCTCGAA